MENASRGEEASAKTAPRRDSTLPLLPLHQHTPLRMESHRRGSRCRKPGPPASTTMGKERVLEGIAGGISRSTSFAPLPGQGAEKGSAG
ncbi:hypothetical protein GN956_G1743 [Arapaima gigas]